MRYSCQHFHFPAVHPDSRRDFIPQGTLPYRLPLSRKTSGFGAWLKPPYIFGALSLVQ